MKPMLKWESDLSMAIENALDDVLCFTVSSKFDQELNEMTTDQLEHALRVLESLEWKTKYIHKKLVRSHLKARMR